jgi:hypothetical protein
MPPSLCRPMAATGVRVALSAPYQPLGLVWYCGERDSDLVSVPLAGSIGTWIVARLYSELPSRQRVPVGPSAGTDCPRMPAKVS